jgi:cytochrome c553
MKTPAVIIAILTLAASTSFAATAAENWKSQCAKCHGADGKGQTAIGKKLKLADYTTAEAQAAFTDEQAVDVISNGIIENGKPKKNAFKEKLSAEEILDLVKHVRAYGPAS